MSEKNGGGQHQLLAIEDLLAARSDYQDVPVDSLGGKTIRLYGLSGVARAKLLAYYSNVLPDEVGDDVAAPEDPELLEKLLMFQVDVVAASMGYPQDQWQAVGAALGSTAVEQLFGVASELSGIGASAADEAVQRLRPARNADTGTD